MITTAPTALASDRFAEAFTATHETSRIGIGADELVADMPDPLEAEHACEMLVRTVFDLLRDTRMEPIAERIAWGIVHSFHKVAEQLGDHADRAAAQVRELVRIGDISEIGASDLEEGRTVRRQDHRVHAQSQSRRKGRVRAQRAAAQARSGRGDRV